MKRNTATGADITLNLKVEIQHIKKAKGNEESAM